MKTSKYGPVIGTADLLMLTGAWVLTQHIRISAEHPHEQHRNYSSGPG